MMSKVNLIKCDFIECRKKAILALNSSKEIQHHQTMVESNKLIKLVSLKIQIEYNNLIIIVKSNPLNSSSDFQNSMQLFTKNCVDEKSLIINQLWDSNLQLNLQFDVLSRTFLNDLKNFGAKILHLCPYMHELKDSTNTLYVENNAFRKMDVDA